MNYPKEQIAVIGLGYVGLPLALEFAKKFWVIGFDINAKRINQLSNGIDETLEVDFKEYQELLSTNKTIDNHSSNGLILTSDFEEIKQASIYIITVPTPIDSFNVPNLTPLLKASKMVASCLKKGDLVIYESTVYPGCTEEECVPLLEKYSGLRYNQDFFVGYSPERINPGDKVNTLVNVKKLTSGSTKEAAVRVDALYKQIITAGTYLTDSIKIAEAAKAIENAQRDVNISFVNELALIFDRLGIDTQDVLDAASTKYNFLHFKPGLVGGHCISVDPFYLAHKASQVGYQPNVILSGRRVNEQMASFVASKVVKLMTAKDIVIKGSKALILGVTFKENCPDIRNSKVVEIYKELQDYGVQVDVYDPWAKKEQVAKQYDIDLIQILHANEPAIKTNNLQQRKIGSTQNGLGILEEILESERANAIHYDAVILAVAHQEFRNMNIKSLMKDNCVLFDIKGVLERNLVDARL